MNRYSLENQFVNIPVLKKAKKFDSSSKRSKYETNDSVNKNFGYARDKEIPVFINQEFLNGTFTSDLSSDMEKQIQYNVQCLCALEWAFNQYLIREEVMASFLNGAIVEMEQHIKDNLPANGSDVLNKDLLREKLSLETMPFTFTKKRQVNIHDLPKDDERRLAFQALFLFALKPKVAAKYKTMDAFLEAYPDFRDRSPVEQEKLRLTANWMDLAFHTVQPKNNKTFILNIIPRIVEGRNVKYVTGSGQTKSTTDRVTLFRTEGNCEKVQRPPRRKRDDGASFASSVGESPGDLRRTTASLFGGDRSANSRQLPIPQYLQEQWAPLMRNSVSQTAIPPLQGLNSFRMGGVLHSLAPSTDRDLGLDLADPDSLLNGSGTRGTDAQLVLPSLTMGVSSFSGPQGRGDASRSLSEWNLPSSGTNGAALNLTAHSQLTPNLSFGGGGQVADSVMNILSTLYVPVPSGNSSSEAYILSKPPSRYDPAGSDRLLLSSAVVAAPVNEMVTFTYHEQPHLPSVQYLGALLPPPAAATAALGDNAAMDSIHSSYPDSAFRGKGGVVGRKRDALDVLSDVAGRELI